MLILLVFGVSVPLMIQSPLNQRHVTPSLLLSVSQMAIQVAVWNFPQYY